jgi:hypothetical protein
MAEPCIIKTGESVDVNDPRLNDTGCTIEPGAIIRPPADLSVAVPAVKKAAAVKQDRAPRVTPVATPPPSEKFEAKEEVATDVVASHTSVESSTAIVVQPEPVQKVDPPMDPATVATIAVGGVAVAGAAAASSAMGGFSAVQAKIASLFGSTKAVVASTAVITAGTIVAVKALEGKMNGLEKDLEKTKKEVGDAASSIDRIDSLLDRLGN